MQSISKSWGKGVTSVQRARNIIAPEKSKKKKRNRKLSKSTWSGPATGIIVLWFAHLFSIVHLGSPSMTYRTINSKGFVPDCEQIYFRHRYRRKHTWASEKIPFFFFFFFIPPCLRLHLHLMVDSLALSRPPHIQTTIVSAKCGSVFLMCGADGALPHCKWALQLQMANSHSKRQTAKVLLSVLILFFFKKMDLSVTQRSAQANVKNMCFHKRRW